MKTQEPTTWRELWNERNEWRTRAEDAEAEVTRLRTVLADIAAMTDADDPESYRSDDREGCLDAVYSKATRYQDAQELQETP